MIDPKRLTEADKGREVSFSDESGTYTGTLYEWVDERVTVICGHCNLPVDPSADDISFSDGGTE